MNKITRICLVEDANEVRNALKNRINSTKDLFCISDYSNGEDALADIPNQNPDIVIMDIGLPKMDGIETMFRIKRENENILFLVFTVFEDDGHVFNALKYGASGYILKGDKPNVIIDGIREILRNGGPMSPEISKKVLKSFSYFNKQNNGIENLTDHQTEILKLISQGLQNKEIADILNIKEPGLRVQISKIYKKLHVNNKVEATLLYLNKNNGQNNDLS